MIEGRLAVSLKIEPQSTTHVDMGVSDGRDTREMGHGEPVGI
jgi:hypothetical protein